MVRRVLQLGVGVVLIAHATVAFAVTQIERSPMPRRFESRNRNS